jgi:site-specific DNA-cytosine methylase
VNVIEVFPCSGGMAEGLRRAGISVTEAYDYDSDACASYEANLGHRPVQIDVRELHQMVASGWRPATIDLLVADPPCTPWSRAGKRLGTADDRDMLKVTVDLVRLLAPRHALIANVPGIDDGPNWPIVQETIGGLSRSGYCIDFARFDAADFGVPQHRVRPFWFVHHATTPHIAWPTRSHGAPTECSHPTLVGTPLRPWVTCRQALQHLSAEELGSPVRLRWRDCKGKQIASVPDRPARVVGTSTLSDGNILAHPDEAFRAHRPRGGKKPRGTHFDEPAARTLTRNTHGDGALLVHDRHPINRPDEPSFCVTTKGDGQGAQGACVLEWPWDAPSTVVTTTDRVGPPGHRGGSFLSGPGAIKLSEKAAAILQGFPDGWHFAGATKRSRWSQIGQAMPPPLAEAVGRSILAAMMRASVAA